MTLPQLNPAQRRAVEHREGPVLVLAGAGSGKTRVLTARLAHLVEDQGLPPTRILAVTFTNKAAQEMRNRVADLLGRDPTGLWIGTFHSLAARLLRREAHLLGFTSRFTIYDEADSLALVKRLLEAEGHSPKTYPPRLIRSIVSAAKNRLLSPDALAETANDPVARVAAAMYRKLGPKLASLNAMDFDDLLLHPLSLFEAHPERLRHYQDRFSSILVDEFQDTNRAQYLFVRALSARHRNLCVVGDDDQSIYGWRGADVHNMLDFERDFGDVTLYRLEENYRSTQMILDAANGVISGNARRLGKTLFTSRVAGEPVTLVETADERDEAEWIARELRQRVANDFYEYADIAVLYRTNAQSRAVEEIFRRTAVPYRVVGSVSFYERREVRDLVAYLRLMVNPADDQAFLRAVQVPKRGLGPASLAALQDAAAAWERTLLDTAAIADRVVALRPHAKNTLRTFAEVVGRLAGEVAAMAPADAIRRVVDEIDYEAVLREEGPTGVERLENVAELVSSAAEWTAEPDPDDPSSPLERFLATSALTTSVEQNVGDPNGVTLMTVHTAKGLEWPVVMVAGLEDGLFPLSRSLESDAGAEEERRLAYVAITRAQDRLYLSWARARRRNGRLMPGRPSRFLEGIPPDVAVERRSSGVFGGDLFRKPLRRTVAPPRAPDHRNPFGSAAHEPEAESQDAPRYIKGERVRHKTFGSGTIKGLEGAGRNMKVTVEFDGEEAGTRQLLIVAAGLERDWDPA